MYDRPLLFACRKWKPGQPDNWAHGHEMGEDCAGLIHEGLWNDFFCEDLISYICEKEMETCTSFLKKNLDSFPNHITFFMLMLKKCSNVILCTLLQQNRLDCSSVLKASAQWAARLNPCGTYPAHGQYVWREGQFYNEPRAAAASVSPVQKKCLFPQK